MLCTPLEIYVCKIFQIKVEGLNETWVWCSNKYFVQETILEEHEEDRYELHVQQGLYGSEMNHTHSSNNSQCRPSTQNLIKNRQYVLSHWIPRHMTSAVGTVLLHKQNYLTPIKQHNQSIKKDKTESTYRPPKWLQFLYYSTWLELELRRTKHVGCSPYGKIKRLKMYQTE